MENKIKNIIKECLTEAFKKETYRKHIKQIVKEELLKQLYETEKKSGDTKRAAVMSTLKDPKYNHAQLAYELYKPQDQGEKDTVRSLFSKKTTGKPDNDGVVRTFSDTEINKLYQLTRKR